MARQINLYDPALQRRRDWLALNNIAATAGVLVVVVAAAGFLARSALPDLRIRAATGETQLKTARDQLTALGQRASAKPDARLEQEVLSARQLLTVRGEVLQILRRGIGPEAVSYADQLRGLSRQSVPGLWLTRFDFNANQGSMEIHGRTSDPALLPEYIRRLNREPVFQGQAFAALKLVEGKAVALAPGGVAAAAPGEKPPYHEFMLIPRKSPLLTQQKTAGGAS